jgi:integrase
MKLPQPRQKENGRWIVQVMVDGKRVGKEFDTQHEALFWAAGLKTKQQEYKRNPSKMTVTQAVDRYIEMKSSVLSPSTIRGYRGTQKCRMDDIKDIALNDLTQEKIQRWVNALSRRLAPKTVANAHGLLRKVLREYKPSMQLNTTLPQKIRTEIQIPSESELKSIMATAKGTKYELPIALGIWLGPRQSEIVGLTWDCLKGDTLHIKEAVVRGEHGDVRKTTKTYAGKRSIKLPPYILHLLEEQPKVNERIIQISGPAIYKGFVRICKKAGVQHYRFHDLRHVSASVMLSIGVPNKYSMKRLGHATDHMLKTTYQHIIKEKDIKYNNMTDAEMEKILFED